MLIDYDRIPSVRNNFSSALSKDYRHENLLNDILQSLLQEDSGKDPNKEISTRLWLVRFLAEYCTELLTGPEDAERVLSCILKRLMRVSTVKPSVLISYLHACTTIVVCFEELPGADGDRSRSTTVNSAATNSPTEKKLETLLVQSLIKFLTHKQTLGIEVEKCTLQCLLELERSIPACLSQYLSILSEDNRLYQGPNKQLWNLLIVSGVRNFLKCVVRFPKVTQRGISSVLLRGISLPSRYTNIYSHEMGRFFMLFEESRKFSQQNDNITAIAKNGMGYFFEMESLVQAQFVYYLMEVYDFYGVEDEKFPSIITCLSKKDALTSNLSSLLLFRSNIAKFNSSFAKDFLRTFERSSQLTHRSYLTNIWYFKFSSEVAKIAQKSLSKVFLQPKVFDKNAVLLEKACKFIEISATEFDNGYLSHQVFSLMKLFTKQIERQSVNFIHQAVFRVLLHAFMYHKACETALKVIILDLCSRYSFLCLPITGLLKSMWKLQPESQFPDACLSSFSDSIASCSFDSFLPSFTDYLPLMSLVAAKSTADLTGFLELLEKALMLSDACQAGAWEVGNGLIEILHNVLECDRRDIYCAEVRCLLQYIACNFSNESVKDSANLYLNLASSVSPKRLGQFFQSVPKDHRPSKSQFSTFLAANNGSLYEPDLNDVAGFNSETPTLDNDSILLCKTAPDELLDDNLKVHAKHLKSFSTGIRNFKDLLGYDAMPNSIKLVFEVSVNQEFSMCDFYALEFVVNLGENLQFRDESAPLSLDHLGVESAQILELDVEVKQISEIDLEVHCVFIDNNLNTSKCPMSNVPLRFQDYFMPFFCAPELRSQIFRELWNHYKTEIEFSETEAADLIYTMEVTGSFGELKNVLKRLVHFDCWISDTFETDDSQITLGIFLPPENHLLIQIKHQTEFAIFHCVISNEELCPMLNNFLVHFETIYRTYNRSFVN